MLNGAALPRPFYIKEEGGRIFVFKEGYRDLVVSGAEGRPGGNPPEANEQPKETGTAHRVPTATWAVEPPGILTVTSQTPKGVAPPGKKTVEGRGEHPCVPLGGGGAAIVRRARHGGLWGRLAGETFWGTERPLQELINTHKALERGIPTAEILGLRLERLMGPISGLALPLYRAEVISKELPETIDLLQLLKVPDSIGSKRREIIKAVAQAVRVMHEGGLFHNDLHLKNILITKGYPFKAYIIDLDKSSLHEPLSLEQRIDNLLRLDRSVEKFIAVGATRRVAPTSLITKRDKLRFLRDYMGGNPPLLRLRRIQGQAQADWKELAKKLKPGYTLHRWWWRINKKL